MVPFVLKCNTVYQEIQQRAKANSTACVKQFNSMRCPMPCFASSHAVLCAKKSFYNPYYN